MKESMSPYAKDPRKYYVGVAGYSSQKFDVDIARDLLSRELYRIMVTLPNGITSDIVIVSGLTNLGIPKLSYEFANRYGMKTVGVACNLAENFECYAVDLKYIVGSNWGDESPTFLSLIDTLVCVGGGEQTKEEANSAETLGIPVTRIPLEALK